MTTTFSLLRSSFHHFVKAAFGPYGKQCDVVKHLFYEAACSVMCLCALLRICPYVTSCDTFYFNFNVILISWTYVLTNGPLAIYFTLRSRNWTMNPAVIGGLKLLNIKLKQHYFIYRRKAEIVICISLNNAWPCPHRLVVINYSMFFFLFPLSIFNNCTNYCHRKTDTTLKCILLFTFHA